MKAFDFEYANKNLSDFGFIICNFGDKGLDTVSNGAVVSFNSIPVQNGAKHELTSSVYEDCLEATMQICKNACNDDTMEISPTEFRSLTKWLCRRKFLKFKLLDEFNIDLYHEAMINVNRIELDGKLVGLELEVRTNRPFSLREPKIINIEYTIESGNVHKAYIWAKYQVIRNYELTTTDIGTTKPSDCSNSIYTDYSITSDGYFKLSGTSYLSGYCYISGQTNNAKSIYRKYIKSIGTSMIFGYELLTLGDTYTEEEKGNLLGNVSSEDADAYPEDGIQNDGTEDYWYTYLRRDFVPDKDVFINDVSHEEGYIYPRVEITVLEDGNLNIHNAIEDRYTYIANCKNGEIITMDYPVISSSVSSHNIQNDFNWNFFRVANTYENSRNDLTISLPCSIKLEYSPIVKVGL